MATSVDNWQKGIGSLTDVIGFHVQAARENGMDITEDAKAISLLAAHIKGQECTPYVRPMICAMLNRLFNETWDLFACEQNGLIDSNIIMDKAARGVISGVVE